MKYLINFLIFVSLFAVASCNKEEEQELFKRLPIYKQFQTETKAVKLSELKDFTDYSDQVFIVNSPEGLPEDIHFDTYVFQNANIDFSKYSLIIAYKLIMGEIGAYQYYWGYNYPLAAYEFMLDYERIKDSQYQDGEIENFTYLRFAMLVDKIPSNSNWVLSSSL